MVAEPLLHYHLCWDSGPASATRGTGGACITRCKAGGTRPPPNTRTVMWGLEPRPEHQFMVAEPLLLPPSVEPFWLGRQAYMCRGILASETTSMHMHLFRHALPSPVGTSAAAARAQHLT